MKMKGIYYIEIDGKYYIGQDVNLNKFHRVSEHLRELKNDKHYNKVFQKAYNERKNEPTYDRICMSDDYSRDELSELEKKYIQEYDSYENGYNLTLGGWGGLGLKYTPEQLQAKSERVLGEDNPQSKLTNEEFYQFVDCLKHGFTNEELGKMWGLHPRYVSLIRHKKRFKTFWETVIDYTPTTSSDIDKTKGLSKEKFFEVVDLLKDGMNMQQIANLYKVDRSTISRINSRKLYKKYWEEYDKLEEI